MFSLIMFDFILLFVLCVVVYKIMSVTKLKFPSLNSIFKSIFKFYPRINGKEMTLMYKTCEICGEKTIYIKGDNTSSLKPINIVDPDSVEVTTKFACDKCYEELMSFIKKEKKDSINLSPELKKIADIFKNS